MTGSRPREEMSSRPTTRRTRPDGAPKRSGSSDPFRLCSSCRQALPSEYPSDVSVCRACELMRHTSVVRSGEGDVLSYLDPETYEVLDLTPELFIAGSRWTFAKTMPQSPMSTPCATAARDAWRSSCLSHDTFEWFVGYIRENGEPARWKDGREWIYFTWDGYKYWTGHAPTEITTIINRAEVGTE